MTTLARIRVAWTGPGVSGGGVSTFHAVGSDGTALRAATNGFFTAIKDLFPSLVGWTVPGDGDLIDDNTGELTGAWSFGGPTNIVGGIVGASYAAGVGARVRWETDGFAGGRHVRGSTYLVPLSTGVFDIDGTIKGANLTTIQSAASAMVTALGGALVIVTRKTPAHSGTSHEVTSATAVDRVSWLVSRRR
jgi:hypothetical protein